MAIRADAKAYVAVRDGNGTVPADDARELAKMGAEKALATTVIAERYGTGIETARKKHALKIKELVTRTRERAEGHESSFEQEFEKALKDMTEKPSMPSPPCPKKKGHANEVAAYEAKLSQAARLLSELKLEAPFVVDWLGKRQADFIERTRDMVNTAQTIVGLLSGTPDTEGISKAAKFAEQSAPLRLVHGGKDDSKGEDDIPDADVVEDEPKQLPPHVQAIQEEERKLDEAMEDLLEPKTDSTAKDVPKDEPPNQHAIDEAILKVLRDTDARHLFVSDIEYALPTMTSHQIVGRLRSLKKRGLVTASEISGVKGWRAAVLQDETA